MSIYFKNLLRDWRKDKKGSVAMMTGLSIPVIIGVGGIAMETSVWNAEKQRTQTAADFSAHAAAIELSTVGPDEALADAVAISQAAEYGYHYSQLETSVVENLDGIQIDVTVTNPVRRYFSQLFDKSDLTVVSNSSAVVESAGEACLLALDPNGDGVELGGTTAMTMNGCLVASNAVSAEGLKVDGSASLAAACAGVVGRASIAGSSVSFSDCTKVREEIPPVQDPYAGLPIPSVASGTFAACAKKPKKDNAPIKSGRYCGGLAFSDNQPIEDGATIMIDGGQFRNSGPGVLSGKDVTIILINNASIFMTSDAEFDLTAKTTGPYAGLIFAGDAKSQSTNHKFAGGTGSKLSGAVYLPTDSVELRGGANMKTGCLHFIAAEIDARGNSDMSNSCDGVGTKPLKVVGGIRMVKS